MLTKPLQNLICTCLLVVANTSFSHQAPLPPKPMKLEPLMQAFGWDLDKIDITSEKISDNFYVLFGGGGNIAVSIGDNGVLLVDDQFPQLMPKINAAINDIGGEKVDFVINTHWHFDHADGNLALGPAGTWIVAQENSRAMMLDDQLINLVQVSYEQKAYPKEALPVITYSDDMAFHFNGEKIELMHFGPAHTTGDTAVIFRGKNAVHLGDVFNNAGYPFIDAGNGGTLDGVIAFCQAVIAQIDSDTTVIPGHGPVTNYQALVDYTAMLEQIRDKMMGLIEQGASLEQVIAAKVTAPWDKQRGDSSGFVNRSYLSLTHKVVDR